MTGSSGSAFRRRITRSFPEVASLVGYGTAIAFGWIVHRQAGICCDWGRQWPVHLAGAWSQPRHSASGWPAWLRCSRRTSEILRSSRLRCPTASRSGAGALPSSALPCAYLSQPGPRESVIVADASYWIYLVHLPIVAAFQVLVGRLPWHWSVKFPLILDREHDAAAGKLPLPRAIHLPRATVERAQISAIAAGSGVRGRRSCRSSSSRCP